MLRYPLIWFVKGWRKFVSPSYGDVCKYHPSCSSYGLTALETHGAVKGVWLTARRLVRCHPWAAGGVDYVPGTPQAAAWAEEISNESRDPHGSQPKTEVA
ncbi:membrane protein insertion efficiency factor YidD [Tessaracoccus sp. G1721]